MAEWYKALSQIQVEKIPYVAVQIQRGAGSSKEKSKLPSVRLSYGENLLQISCYFSFFAEKTLKMTSVWGVQHPKVGQNIQKS